MEINVSSLRDILVRLNINYELYSFSENILNVKFLDFYTDYTLNNDFLVIEGKINEIDTDRLVLNLSDCTLEYHDMIDGMEIIRNYNSNGLDLSMLNLR